MADTVRPDTPRNRGDYDAPHVSPVTPAEDARSILLNKVSWGRYWPASSWRWSHSSSSI